MCGGLNKDSRFLFFGWSFGVLLNWFLVQGVRAKKLSTDRDHLEEGIVRLFDLPKIEGGIIVSSLIASSLFAISQYHRVSQTFGGGKPEPAIIFMKANQRVNLPSQEAIDGIAVDVVFRKGTKIGVKAKDWSDRHILIIDQDKIDRIYMGRGILELDPAKLK
jgi:hypothetical protein